MNIKELKTGQYLQCKITTGNIIARIVRNNVVVLNQPNFYSLPIDMWAVDATPIDFQTAVTLLVQHCTEHNQDVPEIENTTVDAKTLEQGQWFINNMGTIGFVFNKEDACYVSQSMVGYLESLSHAGLVTPITLHQAVITLTKNLLQPISSPYIKSPYNQHIKCPYNKFDDQDYTKQMNKFFQEISQFWNIPPVRVSTKYEEDQRIMTTTGFDAFDEDFF